MFLKQSTAAVISFGPMVDKTDGNTLETGLVSALDHASTGIKLSKAGGALTIRHATVTATTYDGYGNYLVTLDTTDTNTLGRLRVQYADNNTTALPVWQDFLVLPATVYDALVTNATNGSGGLLAATGTVSAVAGYVGASGAAVNGTNVNTLSGHDPGATLASQTNITAGTIATVSGNVGGISGVSFPSNFSALGITAQGAVSNVVTTATATTVSSIDTGGITSASFGAGAIDAAAMNVTGSEFTAIPWNAAWDAEVQSEVEDALVVHRLDELLNADSDIDGAAPPTVGSVFHELMSKTAGSFTFDQTTDSLEALRDRGDSAWVTATGFSTLDAAGVRTAVGLASANLDTQLADLPTVAEFEARTIVAANYATAANQATLATAVADVPTVAEFEARTVAAASYSTLTAAQVWMLTDGIETGVTPKQALQRIGATTAGKASGVTTGTEVYLGLDGSTTRVTATLDGSNNRTAVVYA